MGGLSALLGCSTCHTFPVLYSSSFSPFGALCLSFSATAEPAFCPIFRATLASNCAYVELWNEIYSLSDSRISHTTQLMHRRR